MQADSYAGSAKEQHYACPCCRAEKLAAFAQVSSLLCWKMAKLLENADWRVGLRRRNEGRKICILWVERAEKLGGTLKDTLPFPCYRGDKNKFHSCGRLPCWRLANCETGQSL